MRFSAIVATGSLAVLAHAQSSTKDANSPQSSVEACLKGCGASDVNCQAHCIAVPSPNEDQVNKTTECSRKCDQGDGSPEATVKYGQCLDNCVKDSYFRTSEGTPEATGASGNTGGNGSDASSADSGADAPATASTDAADSTGTDSAAPTNTGSGSDANATDSAAPTASASSGSGSGSDSASASGSGSGSDSTGTQTSTGSGAKKTDDGKNGASGLVASAAAVFAVFAAVVAL